MVTRLRNRALGGRTTRCGAIAAAALVWGLVGLAATPMLAAQEQPGTSHRPGGEVNIQLPDLNQGDFLGMTGHEILLSGLV
ncbi:MAG: hypothetical protein ACRD2N_17030, partial [Vicinamibacterales bacterium]